VGALAPGDELVTVSIRGGMIECVRWVGAVALVVVCVPVVVAGMVWDAVVAWWG